MTATKAHSLGNLRLSTKVTLMTMLALLTLSVANVIGARVLLNRDAVARGEERQEANMRVAWHVLKGLGTDFHVENGDLYAGTTRLNGNNEAVDAIKDMVGSKATIFQGETRIATNVIKEDGSRAVGTPLAHGPVYDAVLGQGATYRGRADILGEDYFTAYDPIKDRSGRVIGVLFVGAPSADFVAQVHAVAWNQTLIALVIMLVAGSVCAWITRGLFRPVAGIRAAMDAMARGDHKAPVPAQDRNDEVGAMAKAVIAFREAAVAKEQAAAARKNDEEAQELVVSTLADGLGKLSDGDLTVAIDRDFPGHYARVKTNFNEAVASLRTLIGQVSESAGRIGTGSNEIAHASEDLARRTEANAASLEETSAALAQIDGRLKATAVAAGKTVERADGAIATVSGGRSVAEEAVAAMGRVSDSAKGIDSVIEGLDKIAFQTRVLAMNAAVEAGRAGEAGRGFAVVADLVSALAMRAEEEAKRARDQLTVTQEEVGSAVESVRKVDEALAAISGDVAEVHQLLGTMAEDNRAQSTAISEIAVAIGTMDQSTQQNAAMVEETSAAARNLTSEVASLTEQAGRFAVGTGAPAPRPAPAPAPQPRPAPVAKARPTPKPATFSQPVKQLPAAAVPALTRPAAEDEGDWKEF